MVDLDAIIGKNDRITQMEQKKTAKKKTEKKFSLTDLISDRFSDTWKLLSETSRFLERTTLFAYYEEDLRSWRLDLQSAGKNEDVSIRIRQEITELRKSLRQQGYDLSLAKQNLLLEGFRSDASLAEGFRRVVIYFGENDVLWLSGEDNHITLAELLEKQLETRSAKRNFLVRSKHYLWYRRRGNDLVLSGSDTETKEDFEQLKAMAEANDLHILTMLKELR